ncbi:bifunctional D-glycero-beta-D-manno-heptose-7-phosphate kinase/D-glycero-beta-D-manno-heptose 1-phosphate adenylyltransferase HldE [Simiduia aestuariiviva]|uniref:Bifunctional protein HldE n=1 Tax=Simiduia aestuariiviva TaxID=1510459 RepID=A0A839UXG2_9GAMM|nr:bifunctional D-glycero-beta-D-manno-heptose-7-phosphate kinase/D-glycero-beta-D-manno-heptose 1-phosphate adenylyltransferase HldE [Simiduia aestuariiviva]MBB3170015.1 D-beta-D-heptose 7-phosphate kinase/D-beta-D-heptose 1-phosphate adenosyltransferase [Simiduia aestuariiviva]
MLLNMPQYTQSQVLVIGDVMLDRYWHGGTSRISPEAPVPVVNVEQVEDRPGGAGNVALNIAALGAGAALVGIVGQDEAGEALKTRLNAANIHTDFQIVTDKPTITKLRVVSRHQQLLRMDFETPYAAADSSEFIAKAEKLVPHMGAVILSDYAKGSLHHVQALIAVANRHQVPVLVDPKGADFSRYQGATLLTPNLHEFETVVGRCDTEQALVDKGLALLDQLQLQALLITRGEHGMTLLRRGMPEMHLPARAREVYDVTGAGDTVISVLAASLAAGEALPQAVGLANLAAGIVVGKLGTATISAPELRRAVKQEQGSERGVLTEEQLLMAIEEARAAGERIVFTNGCFDIIHAGHVGYLEDTRALGDRLIVAINSDESVKRLKGPGRPINPVDRRMAVLAGLEAVDWVTYYDDDTPERLLKLIKPDVLVKGGDYTEDQVVGHEIVKAYGGSVQVLSFFENVSTTAIVKKIQAQEKE